MRTTDQNERHFPLGEPTNRKPIDEPKPAPGRGPGWWVKRDGVPYYIEPPKPEPDITLCLSPAVQWMVDRLESLSNQREASHGT